MMDFMKNAVLVQIRADRKVLWVNVDGVCVLRCCAISYLEVDDQSKEATQPDHQDNVAETTT